MQVALETLLVAATGGLPMNLGPANPAPFQAQDLPGWPLRDYQAAMLRQATGMMRAGVRRILLVLPTGGGKTMMAAAMQGAAAAHGWDSQFLVHRRELVDQTSRTFSELGVAHGFVAAGHPFDPAADVLIAGVQTLVGRLGRVAVPALVIPDEAHHATATTWVTVLDAYGDAYVIGLTATPERLDGRGLKDKFDAMIVGPSTADLIAWGYLSPFDYYAPGDPDTEGVKRTAGDFNRGAIAEIMDKPKLVGDVVEHYLRLARGERGIVFAASREHSRHMAEAFRSEGVRAAHVDGDSKDRDELVNAFRAGDLDVMTNVDLFGEGFDVPDIVYCALARPTQSLSLYLQHCGRDLRAVYAENRDLSTIEARLAAIASGPKPRGIISDHAGNFWRHGWPDTPRCWSLEGREGRARGSVNADAMAIRQCMTCYRVAPSTMKTCPGCGEIFLGQPRVLRTEAGTLTKLERAAIREEAAAAKVVERRRHAMEERRCKTHGDLVRLAEGRGYKNPEDWASVRKKTRARAAARHARPS
jgi:superfamily II DNA or RNA helicase